MSEENKIADTTSVSTPKIIERASQEIIDEAKRMALQTINPEEWKLILSMSDVFWKAGTAAGAAAIPQSFKSSYQVAMAIQAGAEVGLKPIFSVNSISFINGRASIFGEAAIALVRSKGHKIQWGICDDLEANITIIRSDTGESMTGRFTMEMATKRGINKTYDGKTKPAWVSSPDNMLKFKAFHSVAKFLVPDALHNMDVVGQDEIEPRIINTTDHSVSKGKKKEFIDVEASIEGEIVDTRSRLAQAIEDSNKVKEEKLVEEKPIETPPALPPKKKDETPAIKRMREAAEKAQVEENKAE